MENEDEFVADSEEELLMDVDVGRNKDFQDLNEELSAQCLFPMDKAGSRGDSQIPGLNLLNHTSSISQFTFQPDGADILTSISTFTTPSVKPPRPKPRPRYLNKKATEGAPTASTMQSVLDHISDAAVRRQPIDDMAFDDDLSDFPVMSSIADRAKTRQRRTIDPSSAQQWDGDDFMPPRAMNVKAAGKGKTVSSPNPSPRKASSSKGKDRMNTSNDVIELTDGSGGEDDELMLRQKKSAPRTKAMTKPMPLDPEPPQLPEPSIKPPRPKPRPVHRKKKEVDQAKTAERTPENNHSAPPFPAPDTDFASSLRGDVPRKHPIPSSLPPSDPPLSTSQATTHIDVPQIEFLPEAHSDPQDPLAMHSSNGYRRQSEIDELFSGDGDLFGLDGEGFARPPRPVDPKNLPLPPTFFAGSSPQVEPAELSAQRDQGVVDLTIFPTLPQKRKKTMAERDDDNDGDWGAAPSKPKEKKTATKKKKKGAVKSNSSEGQGQVEVVISTKPPDKEDKSRKKKSKRKDDGGSNEKASEAKDAFKSKETIDDSDEDPLLEPYRPAETSAILTSPAVNTSLAKDSSFQELGGAMGEPLEPLSPLPDDMEGDDGGQDAPPVAPKSSRKKRKSTVVQDEDEFDEITRIEDSPSKRRKKEKKTSKEKKGKGALRDVNDLDASVLAKAPSKQQKGKAKANLVLSDDDDVDIAPTALPPGKETEDNAISKENIEPAYQETAQTLVHKSSDTGTPRHRMNPASSLRHSVVSRARGTTMSELIKRVNSLPNSPFPAASSRVPTIAKAATAYSPYLKSSRSLLSKIAPLHPNRRTPPPPLPPPPPKKKTKKELEREERWEEELIETVGIEAWAAMSDMERRDMRKAKQELEMGGWD